MSVAFVFDLDGTLTIVGDRLEELEKSPKDWDAFYSRCGEDEPNLEILKVAKALHSAGYILYYITGRREGCREATVNWLRKWGLPAYNDNLFMRSDGDRRKDTETKPHLMEKLKKRHGAVDIMAIFEDRKSVVDKWRELGYTCVQVAEGDF